MHELKLIGFWRPLTQRAVTVRAVYRYMSGAAWGRTFPALGLTHGVEQILAEPRGTRRVDPINNLDARVEASIAIAGRKLSVLADVFNVTNQCAPDSDWVVPVLPFSGPALGLPTAWRHPRLSLRLAY